MDGSRMGQEVPIEYDQWLVQGSMDVGYSDPTAVSSQEEAVSQVKGPHIGHRAVLAVRMVAGAGRNPAEAGRKVEQVDHRQVEVGRMSLVEDKVDGRLDRWERLWSKAASAWRKRARQGSSKSAARDFIPLLLSFLLSVSLVFSSLFLSSFFLSSSSSFSSSLTSFLSFLKKESMISAQTECLQIRRN